MEDQVSGPEHGSKRKTGVSSNIPTIRNNRGVAVGAGAGLFSPTTAIGNAAVGFFSSLAEQAIGSGDYKNLNVGLASASALGGVASKGLTQYLANSSRSSAAFVITRALGPTRPNTINTFNAITDGFIGASAEIAYQNLK